MPFVPSRFLGPLAVLALLPAACWAAADNTFDDPSQAQPLQTGKARLESPASAPDRPQKADDRFWISIKASSREDRSAVADCGIAMEAIGGQTGDEIAGVGAPKSLERLSAKGFKFDATPLSERFRTQDFPSEDAAFHNYDRTVAALKELAGKRPDLVSLFSIGQSLQGRDLWALRLNAAAKGAAPSAKPGIVFMGTHHAREHLSTEVPLKLAEYLIDNADNHKGDFDVAKLLATRDVYIIPMVNPDGVEIDIQGGAYHMQRKNGRQNTDGSVGVDLNRNYGYFWGTGGASEDPNDETYRGPSAFSEPETQAVKAFVDARPNLKVLLTYHTFSELILYPWGHTYDPLSDGKALAAYAAMAKAMGGMTGYTPEQASALYIASGDTTDWAWGVHGIYSFTFELTPKTQWEGGFYPGADKIAATFANNLRPALYLLDLADNPLRAAETVTGGVQ